MNRAAIENGGSSKTIRGRFEEAHVGDLDGTDSIVSGWIETTDGDVFVYLYNSMLEQSGVRHNDKIEAVVLPGREDDGEMHYEVKSIRLLEHAKRDS